MIAYLSNITRRLRFRIVLLVVSLIIVMAIGFFVFLLRPIGNLVEKEIINETIEAASNIYSICDRSEMEIMRLSATENDPYIKIKKGHTLGMIEDFMQQKGILVIISQEGKNILTPDRVKDSFVIAALKAAGQQEVSRWFHDDMKYYCYSKQFDPWRWRITVLKDAADYAHFRDKILYFYLSTGCLLILGAILLIFRLNKMIQIPLRDIIDQVSRGEKPQYRGIDEFEYLSDHLRVALEQKELKTQELEQTNFNLQNEIRERLQIEANLLKSEQRYRAIVEEQTEYVSRFLADKTLTFVNQALCDQMQMNAEDLIGKKISDFLDRESSRIIEKSLKKINPQNPIDTSGNPIPLPDDGVRHVQWVNRGFFNKNNELIEYQAVGRDVTALKLIEEALRKSRESLEKAQAVAHVGSWEWEIADNTVTWSNEIYTIYGFDRTNFKPSFATIMDIMHPDDKDDYQRLLDNSLQEQSTFEINYRFFQPDGMERIVHNISETIQDRAGNPIRMISTVQDITDRTRMEEEKSKLENKLHQSQKMEAVGSLAAGIAHDFNNILHIIFGIVETTMNEVTKGSQVYDNLKEISKVGQRAASLVKQIVTFSKQSRHEKQTLSLQPLLKEIVSEQRKVTPTDIKIELQITQPCKPIFANLVQIHQVVTNLIVNAAQAMEDQKRGELNISIKEEDITPKKSERLHIPTGEYVHLRIADNGPGMDQETVDKIFDPYFSTKEMKDGAGLGLAIVYSILSAHDASITVKSDVGQGTTFDIHFPVIATAFPAEEHHRNEKQVTQDQPARIERRILLVDDEKISISNWKIALSQQGDQVVGKTDPDAALNTFRKNPQGFDIVITDQKMPHKTGYELAHELRMIRPDIPIVLATGWGDFDSEEQLLEQKIQLINKPHQLQELLEAIEKAISLVGKG